MQPTVLRALEFDRVREALAREALTPLGRTRALALDPATSADEIQRRLEMTSHAVAFVRDGGSLALHAPEDLGTLLAVLAVGDEPLDPLGLLGVSAFLESVERVVDGVRRGGGGLRGVADRAGSFAEETGAVRRAIDPGGDVNDRASSALRDIRDALRRQRAKLRSSLESLARGRDTAKYLQDQIVTDRNGRYVLVVRAEHRDAIAGIVHGSSASGASLYLEPLSTVGLNNDVVSLVERERAEIRRILVGLTNGFRARADELEATLDVAADFDELHAKAALARRMDGVAPALDPLASVDFRGARHPLLIPAVRDLIDPETGSDEETRGRSGARPKNPIASDLRVVPPTQALVISGPNTGGKTVALKAFGLLSLMAQAGLLIPVEGGSRFRPFRTVFADIGDEQSIAASLSTFSAHIGNIVTMDRELELPALGLLDEVGGGTDPTEGGALGAAVIDHFRRRGAMVVATTHDDLLKSYAATTDGVTTAGFGFNPDNYAPTYRLLYGSPGRSLAFEIAERLGIPAEVVADARTRRSNRESQLAAHLARVDQELASLDRERTMAVAERQTVADERQRLLDRESRLAEREALLKKRLDDRVNEKLRDARAEVDQIIGTLKKKADAMADQAAKHPARGPLLSTGDLGGLRAEARAALGAVGDKTAGDGTSGEDVGTLADPPVPGQAVFVASFGARGIVRAVTGKNVEVEIRGKRMRVPMTSLRASSGEAAPQAAPARPAAGRAPASRAGGLADPSTTELVVIGSTVDQAIDRAEKFLDDALLADEKRLRIVHGHGTGKLREALTKFLRVHPLVSSVAAAGEREGGAGATIVELKD